ncbi:phage portal protein, partial [Streptomyces racemochromogenes]
MGIWRRLSSKLFGGGYVITDGPTDPNDPYQNGVTADLAMRLSAVWASMNIRAETGGHLPFNLRDKNKNPVSDHPLDFIIRRKANALQTSGDLMSQIIAQMDMCGNHVSLIDRGTGGKIVGLLPQDPDQCSFEVNKSGTRRTWKIDGQDYNDRDVLHIPSFSLKGGWGAARLDIGRQILGAQLEANRSAIASFRNGMKVGGFFKVDKNPTAEQIKDFANRMDVFARP